MYIKFLFPLHYLLYYHFKVIRTGLIFPFYLLNGKGIVLFLNMPPHCVGGSKWLPCIVMVIFSASFLLYTSVYDTCNSICQTDIMPTGD